MTLTHKIRWSVWNSAEEIDGRREQSSAGDWVLYWPCKFEGRFMLWNRTRGGIKYFNRENEAKKFVENQLV